MRHLVLAAFLSLIITARSIGQSSGAGKPGPRPSLGRAEEVALARSGAPASISARATIYVFADGRYQVADPGTSDVACLVNRSWPLSLEPECFDGEAAVTIMPMEIRRTELYHRNVPAVDVEREIAAGISDGTFRLPTRPAIVYMMSAGQRLIGDDGRPVGSWKPHLMIHSPYLTNAQAGHFGDPDMTAGLVVDSGKPTANLMVIVPAFVPVPGSDQSKR